MWIRNQEVTLGEAEGRERSREIGRQRETGGLGGEKERHRVGREELVVGGWKEKGSWLGSKTGRRWAQREDLATALCPGSGCRRCEQAIPTFDSKSHSAERKRSSFSP